MKRDIVRVMGAFLLGGTAMLAGLPGCGGSTGAVEPVPAVPQTTAMPAATVALATPTATIALTPTTSSTGSSNSALLAQGKLVFEKTAGGVGCAYCHGLDGKGGGVAGQGAPDIRGATEAKVRAALSGVALMSFIKLSDEEITAMVAYLQYLNQ